MASKSETIRNLAGDGKTVSEIAQLVDVRYQHAYNVLAKAGMLPDRPSGVGTSVRAAAKAKPVKPILTVELLDKGGFSLASRWLVTEDGELVLERALPKSKGVYALVKDGAAFYVGLATMGLAKRLYFYGRPGATQRTSQRVNLLLKSELEKLPHIDIFIATPPDQVWNGLPINGNAGLELGLIEKFYLPWNIRGAG